MKRHIPIFTLLLLFSCDIFTPQNRFKIAVPENDFTYNNSAGHLKECLEKGGFRSERVPAVNAIEANQMVAKGEADLTFAMNLSDFIPETIGANAGKLRTLVPMFRRLFFIFSRFPVADSLNARELLAGKKIGLEVLNGETHRNLELLFESGRIKDVKAVTLNDTPDLIHFWGTFYGPRATDLIEHNWSEISIDPAWIDFVTLNDPALAPFTLPAIPGIEGSKNLHTFSVETLLVGRADLGEKSVYKLSEYIFQHKLELMGYDLMYRSINEGFDVTTILFPLHNGTDSFLRRDEPSFFEKYAEVMALIFSVGAILYGALQAIRNRIMKQKKERIDLYFLDFLDVRSQKIPNSEKAEKLDELLQRALVQMTNERLDKGDFHIFSRLLQQELANIR